MALVIYTNMGAINANRMLDHTGRDQDVTMARLTSGKSINHSADNAAGMSVATEMTKQSMGLDQAVRNANDGISLIQTVDGATDEIVSVLQRMRELAVQSMNGTYSDANRDQMDAEFIQLQTEIDRIGETAKFNGISLLASAEEVVIQVGWETNNADKITVTTANLSLGAMSVTGDTISTAALASDAISAIDNDLSDINVYRAKWGALQNRMESTVANLQNVSENTVASRSRIEDADFARESANLARTQVLQDAGLTMLSQANQNAQNIVNQLR